MPAESKFRSYQPRVLLACECSGRVRDEFAKRGWEAWSADILASETPAYITVFPDGDALTDLDGVDHGNHYLGDVRDLFSWDHPVNEDRLWSAMGRGMRYAINEATLWDLTIAFPPCTDLSYAGAVWFQQKQADGRQDRAAEFFMEMINAPAPYVAVENPRGVMFKRHRRPDQTVQPWWFGDPFEKNTCLWLKNLPLLEPEFSRPEELARVATGGGSWRTDKAAGRKAMSAYEDSEGRRNRDKVRSRTFPGVARAMAAQWGAFVEGELA